MQKASRSGRGLANSRAVPIFKSIWSAYHVHNPVMEAEKKVGGDLKTTPQLDDETEAGRVKGWDLSINLTEV